MIDHTLIVSLQHTVAQLGTGLLTALVACWAVRLALRLLYARRRA